MYGWNEMDTICSLIEQHLSEWVGNERNEFQRNLDGCELVTISFYIGPDIFVRKWKKLFWLFGYNAVDSEATGEAVCLKARRAALNLSPFETLTNAPIRVSPIITDDDENQWFNIYAQRKGQSTMTTNKPNNETETESE
jgi:hypothetical protein